MTGRRLMNDWSATEGRLKDVLLTVEAWWKNKGRLKDEWRTTDGRRMDDWWGIGGLFETDGRLNHDWWTPEDDKWLTNWTNDGLLLHGGWQTDDWWMTDGKVWWTSDVQYKRLFLVYNESWNEIKGCVKGNTYFGEKKPPWVTIASRWISSDFLCNCSYCRNNDITATGNRVYRSNFRRLYKRFFNVKLLH